MSRVDPQSSGLLFAHGLGKRTFESFDELKSWSADDGPLWVHLDRNHPQSSSWLQSESGLPEADVEALLVQDSRPRLQIQGQCALLILRGVNLNEGADPADMVSLRISIEPQRIISLRGAMLLAVRDVQRLAASDTGPKRIGEWVAEVCLRITDRMAPVLSSLQESLDELEEELLQKHSSGLRDELASLRRQAVSLRRYLLPQREVLSQLLSSKLEWLNADDLAALREAVDRTTRYIEDLEAIRERAAFTQEELIAGIQDRLNRNLYLLSLITAVFLPLGFVTGLLGINVGGMPGTESEYAFFVVSGLLVGIAVLELGLLWARRWW